MKILALILAIVFLVIGVLYWNGTIQFGASRPGPHHLHAILFYVLALVAIVWSRFQRSAR